MRNRRRGRPQAIPLRAEQLHRERQPHSAAGLPRRQQPRDSAGGRDHVSGNRAGFGRAGELRQRRVRHSGAARYTDTDLGDCASALSDCDQGVRGVPAR